MTATTTTTTQSATAKLLWRLIVVATILGLLWLLAQCARQGEGAEPVANVAAQPSPTSTLDGAVRVLSVPTGIDEYPLVVLRVTQVEDGWLVTDEDGDTFLCPRLPQHVEDGENCIYVDESNAAD